MHVDDLIACFSAAVGHIDRSAGEVYNVGGGADNALSVWWQLAPVLQRAIGTELPEPSFAPWRLGDQRVFIADSGKAGDHLGWSPTISPDAGMTRLLDWIDSIGPQDMTFRDVT